MRTPGVIEFRRKLVADLADGYSVLCLVSDGDSISVQEQLRADIHAADQTYAVIDPTGQPQDDWPLEVLRRQLARPPARSPAYDLPQFLADHHDLPEIIIVAGLDELGSARARWLHFFGEWAQASHSLLSTGGPQPSRLLTTLCLADGDDLPPDETRLRRHWWWALPSRLEMALLCRLRADQEGEAIGPRHLWREAILPALAGNDPALLEFLWDDVFGSFDHLLDRLAGYAAACDWTPETLRRWGIHDYQRRRAAPRRPERLDNTGRRLWARGVLGYTPEHGPALSSAALAAVGDSETIHHRLWHGQAALTLPLLDQFRRDACRQLAGSRRDAFGDGDIMEWGDLLAILRSATTANLRALADQVDKARITRNALAHYHLIHYQEYERLLGFLG